MPPASKYQRAGNLRKRELTRIKFLARKIIRYKLRLSANFRKTYFRHLPKSKNKVKRIYKTGTIHDVFKKKYLMIVFAFYLWLFVSFLFKNCKKRQGFIVLLTLISMLVKRSYF